MDHIGDEFKSGDKVPHSGIYKVVHDPHHAQEHEVTCVYGKTFPSCDDCGDHVRFILIRDAQQVSSNEHFSW